MKHIYSSNLLACFPVTELLLWSLSVALQLNNIIHIARPWITSDLQWELSTYKKEVNNEALEVQICLTDK